DRIKETLFNIIAPDIFECNFLDLFSGSGSIGIEALSRGAKKAVFVENNKNAFSVIEENLNHTKLVDKAQIYKTDVIGAIKNLGSKMECFDIIFLDPPYNGELYGKTLEAIVESGILAKDGYIIAEHSAKNPLPDAKGLKVIRHKDYKTTIMSFLILEA
ncbi:MAG: 16S rRNA (guanine(966)-N(2))-methyltransferase RsmD, partial [Anaerotignaceae bacterium]